MASKSIPDFTPEEIAAVKNSSSKIPDFTPEEIAEVKRSTPSLNASKLADQFKEATISDLTGIGAMTGGVLGALSPIPGGSVLGAGIGGYTGHAAKNLINNLRGSEDAPKEALDYVSEPIKEGVESATAEAIGQKILVPVFNKAGEILGYTLKKGGEVLDWGLKKGGNIIAGVSEKNTSEFLKTHGNLPSRPLKEIVSEINQLHKQADSGVTLSKDKVSELRSRVLSLKDEVAQRKQLLEDQFADQKYLTGQKASEAKDQFSKASELLKENYKSKSAIPESSNVLAAIEKLQQIVNKESLQSLRILEKQKGMVSLFPIRKALLDGIDSLRVKGLAITGTDATAIKELQSLVDRITPMGDQVSFAEAKKVLQRLGHDTTWTPNAGAYAEIVDGIKQKARKAFDQSVKDIVPEYGSKMVEVDKSTRLLKEVSKKFGTPDLAKARLNTITSARGKHSDYELLKKVGKETGYDFEKPIQEVIQANEVLKSPRMMRELEQQLPQYANFQTSKNEQARLAMPETRRQVRERVKQSLEYETLLKAREELDQAIQSFKASQQNFEPYAPFNIGSIEGLATSLNGARPERAKEAFAALDQATGKNFTQEVTNRSVMDSFLKGDPNGSRKTLMGAIAGKAITTGIGSLLGYEGTHNPYGAALGALAGFSGDKYAGRVLKGVLIGRIKTGEGIDLLGKYLGKYAEPLVKGATYGPSALSLTGTVLSTDPGFRSLMGVQPTHVPDTQVPVPQELYQQSLLMIDGAKSLTTIDKAKAIDSLNRTGTVNSQYLRGALLDPSQMTEAPPAPQEIPAPQESPISLEEMTDRIRNNPQK